MFDHGVIMIGHAILTNHGIILINHMSGAVWVNHALYRFKR